MLSFELFPELPTGIANCMMDIAVLWSTNNPRNVIYLKPNLLSIPILSLHYLVLCQCYYNPHRHSVQNVVLSSASHIHPVTKSCPIYLLNIVKSVFFSILPYNFKLISFFLPRLLKQPPNWYPQPHYCHKHSHTHCPQSSFSTLSKGHI